MLNDMRIETRMTFTTLGKDYSLDFVKGYAIICVLLNHCLDHSIHQQIFFYIWGLPAVPLFLLVQTFHAYKRGCSWKQLSLMKLWTRVMKPFFIVVAISFLCKVLLNPMIPVTLALRAAIYGGGRGPGSYYPWIYLQFAILLPLLAPVFRRLHGLPLALFFLALSIGGEMFCSWMHIPEWLYRLLCLRYVFLIYLGYLLVKEGAVLNKLTLFLSAVSLVALWWFEHYNPNWEPFFFHSSNWYDMHWICYFYIAFPMMYLLAKVFYRLRADGLVENVFCSLGRHSFAIFIFQLFYFSTFAPYVQWLLAFIGNENIELALYTLAAMVGCTVPVIYFVSGKKDMVILYRVAIIVFALFIAVVGLFGWWRPLYTPSELIPPYEVKRHSDDSVRVIMIGDSWAHFHETLRRDSLLELNLRRDLKTPKALFHVRGRGGATSGEIYNRLSAERVQEIDYDMDDCLQPLILTGPDYCIISAGINDARQRRGKDYYVNNYLQMVRLLLHVGIRPVVIEIPDVEVDEAFDGNTLYYRLRARICMFYLKTSLYGTNDYRQALKDALHSSHLMDSVLYIPYAAWNPDGWRDERDIYVDDHFHLNLPGYAILDSCLSAEIAKDWKQRHP